MAVCLYFSPSKNLFFCSKTFRDCMKCINFAKSVNNDILVELAYSQVMMARNQIFFFFFLHFHLKLLQRLIRNVRHLISCSFILILLFILALYSFFHPWNIIARNYCKVLFLMFKLFPFSINSSNDIDVEIHFSSFEKAFSFYCFRFVLYFIIVFVNCNKSPKF